MELKFNIKNLSPYSVVLFCFSAYSTNLLNCINCCSFCFSIISKALFKFWSVEFPLAISFNFDANTLVVEFEKGGVVVALRTYRNIFDLT